MAQTEAQIVKAQNELVLKEKERVQSLGGVFQGSAQYGEFERTLPIANPISGCKVGDSVILTCGETIEHYFKDQTLRNGEKVTRSFVIGSLSVNGEDKGIQSVSISYSRKQLLKAGQDNLLKLTETEIDGRNVIWVESVVS